MDGIKDTITEQRRDEIVKELHNAVILISEKHGFDIMALNFVIVNSEHLAISHVSTLNDKPKKAGVTHVALLINASNDMLTGIKKNLAEKLELNLTPTDK